MRPLQKVGLILAALILVAMFFVPVTETFTYEARNTMGVVIVVIILLVTEAFPLGIVSMVGLALLVVFGAVPNMGTALVGFANPVLFFVLVSFGMSEALVRTPLSMRVLLLLARKFGQSSKMSPSISCTPFTRK